MWQSNCSAVYLCAHTDIVFTLVGPEPTTAQEAFDALQNDGLSGAGIYVGMILALANHSAFSMMRLSKLHATTTTLAEQNRWLTAGEAVIATDMWNTTVGFLVGIFMQGAFVFISLVMWRSKEFGKSTAITGLLATGLDLLHVFVMLWAPATAMMLLSIGGFFYMAWLPLLGGDLLKLGKSPQECNE